MALDDLLATLHARDERAQVVSQNLSAAEEEFARRRHDASSKRQADMRRAEGRWAAPQQQTRSPAREREIAAQWRQEVDPSSGRPFFHNTATGAVEFDRARPAARVPVAPTPPATIGFEGSRIDLHDLLWQAEEKRFALELSHRRGALDAEEKALLSTRQAVAHILQWTPGLADDVLIDMQQRLHALGAELSRVHAEQKKLDPESIRRAGFGEGEHDSLMRRAQGGAALSRSPTRDSRRRGWQGVRLRREAVQRFRAANGPAMVHAAVHDVLTHAVVEDHPEAAHVIRTAVQHAVSVAIGEAPEVAVGPAASAVSRWGALQMDLNTIARFKQVGGPAAVHEAVHVAVAQAVGKEHPEMVDTVGAAVEEAVAVAVGEHPEQTDHVGSWGGVRSRLNGVRHFNAVGGAPAAAPQAGGHGWGGLKARMKGASAFKGSGADDASAPRGWNSLKARMSGVSAFKGSGADDASAPRGWNSLKARMKGVSAFKESRAEESTGLHGWANVKAQLGGVQGFNAAAPPSKLRGWDRLRASVRGVSGFKGALASAKAAKQRWTGLRLRHDCAQKFRRINGPAVVKAAVHRALVDVVDDHHPEAGHVVRTAIEKALDVSMGDAPNMSDGAAANPLSRWGALRMTRVAAARFHVADGPEAVKLAVQQAVIEAVGTDHPEVEAAVTAAVEEAIDVAAVTDDSLADAATGSKGWKGLRAPLKAAARFRAKGGHAAVRNAVHNALDVMDSDHPEAAHTVRSAVKHALSVAMGDHPEVAHGETASATQRWGKLQMSVAAAHKFKTAGGVEAVDQIMKKAVDDSLGNAHPEVTDALHSAVAEAVQVAVGDHPEVAGTSAPGGRVVSVQSPFPSSSVAGGGFLKSDATIMLFKNATGAALDVYGAPHHHSVTLKEVAHDGIVLVRAEQVRVKSMQTLQLVNWMQTHDGRGWVHETDPRTGARSLDFVDNITNEAAETFTAIENGVSMLSHEKSASAVAMLMEAARKHAVPTATNSPGATLPAVSAQSGLNGWGKIKAQMHGMQAFQGGPPPGDAPPDDARGLRGWSNIKAQMHGMHAFQGGPPPGDAPPEYVDGPPEFEAGVFNDGGLPPPHFDEGVESGYESTVFDTSVSRSAYTSGEGETTDSAYDTSFTGGEGGYTDSNDSDTSDSD